MKVYTGHTFRFNYSEGEGDVYKQMKIPDIIPIHSITSEQRLNEFKELYIKIYGELDFCTTCPSAIKWAANRLNNYYGKE